ncbi:MAG TPA: hypothetical protein VMS31_00795, partial [Pyrinomonadaceae bacterium]|nr:hypothetical protein [Pyrinomonadaceae bacterium]
DLADYLFQFQTGRVKYQVGNFSFGNLRHLINGFPSRGITVTVPLLTRFDFSAAAMNGSLPVGYGNFFGLNRRRHQLLSGTMGVEIFAKRPGGLRLEVGGLAASVQPITGVNTGAIVNQQRSRGFSMRLVANDQEGRFHFDGGFTRSFSIHPSGDDTLLEESGLTKNAQYLEVRYQVLKDFSLSKTRKANLTVTFTEQNVAASFESVGASAEADKIRYRFQLEGSVNDISGSFSYGRDHNNLDKILPQRVQTASLSLSLAAPAKVLIGRTKDSPWLPGLTYSFARDHGFGIAIPVAGGFVGNLSDLPNEFNTNHNFTARWQVNKFNIAYVLGRMPIDNQQFGRELADYTTLTNAGTFGVAVNSKLDLNLILSAQSVASRENGTIDRTYVLGPGIIWKPTNQMTVTVNFSNILARDVANFTHSRSTNFDASWSYSFNVGKQELKKLAGSFSVSYSNGYQRSLDRRLPFDNLSKNQALITSMSFTLF